MTSPSPARTTALGISRPTTRSLVTIGRILAIALALLVFALPLWSIVSTAFTGKSALRPGSLSLVPTAFTVDNVATIWRLGGGRAMFVSTVVVVVGLTLQLTVSALAAYALARKKFRGASVVLVLILVTMMLPDEVLALPLYSVLADLPDPLGGEPSMLNTFSGLTLPLVGWALPIYVLTAFMKTIPMELEEAARIDGAGDLRVFLRLILPLCRPALGTCAIFGFLMIWDQYLLPLLVAQDPSMNTLTLAVTAVQSNETAGDGVRMAGALLLLVPSVVIYLLLQRFFERGALSGAVKG